MLSNRFWCWSILSMACQFHARLITTFSYTHKKNDKVHTQKIHFERFSYMNVIDTRLLISYKTTIKYRSEIIPFLIENIFFLAIKNILRLLMYTSKASSAFINWCDVLKNVRMPLKVKVDHHHHHRLQFNSHLMCNDSMEFFSYRYRHALQRSFLLTLSAPQLKN